MLRRVFIALSLLAFSVIAIAQEGHPLTGSWHGSISSGSGKPTPVLFFMKWNSKEIEGAINPGPNAMPLKVVTLDPNNWTVHFEADAKDKSHIVIDGKLENIGSYNRTITGTWMQGDTKSNFKITRD